MRSWQTVTYPMKRRWHASDVTIAMQKLNKSNPSPQQRHVQHSDTQHRAKDQATQHQYKQFKQVADEVARMRQPSQEQARSPTSHEESPSHEVLRASGPRSLSEIDIDEVLKLLPAPHLPAATFARSIGLHLKCSIGRILDRQAILLSPVWCLHHWMAGVFEYDGKNTRFTIYDSAPSHIVRTTVHQMMRRWWPALIVAWGDVPQQRRYSEDCGIFTIITLVAVACNFQIHYDNHLPDRVRQHLLTRHQLEPADFVAQLKHLCQTPRQETDDDAIVGSGPRAKPQQIDDSGDDCFNPSADRQRRAQIIAKALHNPEVSEEDECSTNDESDTDSDTDDATVQRRTNEVRDDPMTHLFRSGHHTWALPVVTQLTGHDLMSLLAAPEVQLHPTFTSALAESTRREHRRILSSLSLIKEDLHLPLTLVIINFYENRRRERTWTWSTFTKMLTNAFHALIILPCYRDVPHGVNAFLTVQAQQALKGALRQKASEKARIPKSMTPQTFVHTLAAIPQNHLGARAILALMWMTTQRVGCVLSLLKEDIVMTNDVKPRLRVTFRFGKGVKLRGHPYTIHTTALPTFVAEPIQTAMQGLRPTDNLFPKMTADKMLPFFRLVDPLLEARSIRRGSLQCLAQAGTPTEVLLMYSGHTNAKTLFRYLNWGEEHAEMRTHMARAGTSLLPEEGQQSPQNPTL